MPTNHAAVAALPIGTNSNKELLRNAITARMPYVLDDADDVTDLVAVDPDTGSAIIDILFLGRLFHYDSTDTTTANDGITCLVTSDGRRYKLSDGSDVFAYSVLDNTIATPPVTPTIGDAYLIASGATGAWAGKAGYIGAFTRRGWEFLDYQIGRFVYVESVDTYYHKDSGGSWVLGFGNQTFGANSMPLSASINFGKIVIVENQTTNAPPGSPSVGDAYIIGPSPTGSWAGNAAKIAVCEAGTTFTIYTPLEGWQAYDKALNTNYQFTGSAWSPVFGAIAQVTDSALTVSGSQSNQVGTGFYTYSNSIAPTTSHALTTDGISISHTAKRTGARLRFLYRVNMTSGSNAYYTVALFRDGVADALDWVEVAVDVNGSAHFDGVFDYTAPDALAHTYFINIIKSAASNGPVLNRRLLTCEERA